MIGTCNFRLNNADGEMTASSKLIIKCDGEEAQREMYLARR